MKGFKILKFRKKSGGWRFVCAPNRKLKARLRLMVPGLNARVLKECDPAVVHGFVPGRSPVTNARPHIGKKFTLCVDLKDFFDRVTPDQVKLPKAQREVVFAALKKDAPVAARQGFPTSPAVSNLAAVRMDADLQKICRPLGIVYTRYADDLSFSGDDVQALVALRDQLPGLVEKHGHQINPKKTRIQSAAFGRRVITGVAVSETGIHPTREVRRRLRAAVHQARLRQAHGLREWSLLKPPTGRPRLDSRVAMCVARHAQRRLEGIADTW